MENEYFPIKLMMCIKISFLGSESDAGTSVFFKGLEIMCITLGPFLVHWFSNFLYKNCPKGVLSIDPGAPPAMTRISSLRRGAQEFTCVKKIPKGFVYL